MNGSPLHNNKATVKSLTTKRLSDFMDAANKSNPVSNQVPSIVADRKPTFQKYSIINLEPAMLETDEIVDEAPLLFVGKASIANPMQNLPDIIESYKIFLEISSIEDKDVEDQFRSVSFAQCSPWGILCLTIFVFHTVLI